jgi:small subunit ribosomal protein MRP21
MEAPFRSLEQNDMTAGLMREITPPTRQTPPLRLKPSLGRTVQVYGDPAKAFRMLERRCTDNSVKRDEVKQKFHIRKGQQRKNDKMRRWRVTFKEGFIAECDRIRRMKKQGW